MRPALALLAILGSAGLAHAHGGLPVSQRILRQGDGSKLYVPVVYWGVWVGGDGTPWKWICEEEINTNRNRHVALSTDGTFYATDVRGLTVSTDKGCTWKAFAGGEVADKRITDVTVDTVDGALAWVTSAESGGPTPDGGTLPGDNALFVTHDHGSTFTRVPGLADQNTRLFQSVRIGPTSQTLYVVSTQLGDGPVAVHRSDDGGVSFHTYLVSYTLGGLAPYGIDLLAVDPRNAMVVYLRVFVSGTDADGGDIARQALLRSSDGGATFAELATIDGIMAPSGMSRGIDGVAIDVTRNQVLVATAMGLLSGDDPGGAATVTLQPISTISQAQCVDVHAGEVTVCSTNYMPDNAALARSDDGAKTFQTILQFVDTVGPVDCPAGTPVGDLCPSYWEMYGSQLGITFSDGGVEVMDGGTTHPPGGGCSCEVGARAALQPTLRSAPGPIRWLSLALVPLAIALRRRRSRDA